MPRITIITHCYAEKRPEFAAMLTAQISSLHLWPPKTCEVCLIVVMNENDKLALRAFSNLRIVSTEIGRMCYADACFVDYPHLLRRAIGRNIEAKADKESDIVWFADADYLFGDGCLDALAAAEIAPKTNMILPAMAAIHKSHEDGDREIARIVPGELFEPDLSLFKPWRPKLCIGGLQIVPGHIARQGYLDNTKWTRPTQADDFQNTREDRAYRLSLGGKAQVVEMPNLYRMRHSCSAFQSAESRLKQTQQAASHG